MNSSQFQSQRCAGLAADREVPVGGVDLGRRAGAEHREVVGEVLPRRQPVVGVAAVTAESGVDDAHVRTSRTGWRCYLVTSHRWCECAMGRSIVLDLLGGLRVADVLLRAPTA